MKQCARCERTVEDETKKRNWKGVWCKPCFLAWARENYQKRKEQILERNKQWRTTAILAEDSRCPKCGKPSSGAGKPYQNGQGRLCLEHLQDYDRKRYQRHRMARRKHAKERYRLNPEISREYAKQSYQRNHARLSYLGAKYRAKKRGVMAFCSFEEWQDLLTVSQCHWCHIEVHPSFRQIDHVVPIAEGGQHTRDNLVVSCANCNARRAWEQKVKYPHLYHRKGDD